MSTTADLRKPDQFLQTLRDVLDWVVSKAIWFIGAVLIVGAVAGTWAVWNAVVESKEASWQEKYFVVEKQYLDIKREFQNASQKDQLRRADPKSPAAAGAVGKLPSGDLVKDYGAVIAEFEKLVSEAPKTRAGEMSALNLAVIHAQYNKMPEALATLQKVNTNDRTKDLTGALIVNLKASLQANQDQCPEAITRFEKIIKDKSANFLHNEARLRMGLCYEKMNDLAKAQAAYNEISANIDEKGDRSLSQDAERYLRLLKMKQSNSGS